MLPATVMRIKKSLKNDKKLQLPQKLEKGKNIVTNPFLKGFIGNLAVVQRSEKEQKIITNPFLKGWIGNLAALEIPEKEKKNHNKSFPERFE